MADSLLEIPESHQGLLQQPIPAVVTTINADGSLASAPVWFLVEGGLPRLSSVRSSLRVRNLVDRPQCGFVILDVENTNRYIEVRGRAEIESDADYAFADCLGPKYGADLRSWDGPDAERVAITIVPSKIRTVDAS